MLATVIFVFLTSLTVEGQLSYGAPQGGGVIYGPPMIGAVMHPGLMMTEPTTHMTQDMVLAPDPTAAKQSQDTESSRRPPGRQEILERPIERSHLRADLTQDPDDRPHSASNRSEDVLSRPYDRQSAAAMAARSRHPPSKQQPKRRKGKQRRYVEILDVAMPDIIGLEKSIVACNGGVSLSMLRKLFSFLSYPIDPKAVSAIKKQFYAAENGRINRAPSPKRNTYEVSEDSDSDWLQGSGIPFHSSDADGSGSPLDWRGGTLLSLTSLLPLLKRAMQLDRDATIASRMTTLSDRFCRLLALEEANPKLAIDTPISCALMDTVVAVSLCHAIAFSVNQTSCDDPSATPTLLKDFPTAKCHLSPKTAQFKAGLLQRPFTMTDPQVDVPIMLRDLRMLPRTVPDSVRDEELLTYLILYRAAQMHYRLGQLNLDECDSVLKMIQLIPGWDVRLVISENFPNEELSMEGNIEHRNRGIGSVTVSSRKRVPCHFAIGIRGTASRFEWVIDFHHWAAPLLWSNVYVHGGIARVLSIVGSPLVAYLQKLSRENNCTCENTRITTYGHSLGGGIAAVLALHLHQVLNLNPAICTVEIDAVTFSSPRVFSPAAAMLYKQKINARQIIHAGDPLHHFPCPERNGQKPPPWMRCAQNTATVDGVGHDRWADLPAVVEVSRGHQDMTCLQIDRSTLI
eukprot:Blabericola_migrator_1__11267@NODE_663_length_6971_cov_273_239426_g484_i0_p1_GENE_NODE_663_length_6971_cov_273_239426_g484_i0NODE_663_length_6971_cov_273_239426_g484_i0_p1_ORF_typecomplete_len684_score66_11Lipase_3/PF01764_25/2_6e22DUF2974/PF11187_8/0_00022DUF818/PF05677_12/0_00019DUF676/PF05057_14/0_002Chlorophyllase2/PF12740_7/0_0023Abhydrolase_3/PF07859_13/5_3e03Abhydrolase_3/PF07859_13/1_8e03Abhydrolase_3/PF07859_13/0_0058BAAT_C/PF08840_11/0_0058Hydrolase_4/PF12146_8/0_011Chlorophyllase/PF07